VRHDLQAFSRSILTLIKTGGDTGDTGDKSNKPNNCVGLGATTNPNALTPLDPEWRRDLSGAGDRIFLRDQAHTESVPTVATVTTNFKRVPAFADVLFARLAAMRAADPPEGFSFAAWRQLCIDGDAFVRRWAAQTASLGWTDLDIFGVHSSSPAGRVGCWGLALLIQGGEVDSLTIDRAVIRRRSGAKLTWRRCDAVQRVPIWQLLQDADP
jgi:hypothetical protein